MRVFMTIVIVSVLPTVGPGQTIPSSCSAPDSIKAKYIKDADRLALRRIYDEAFPYTDSIEIPQEFSDSMLNALISVYNAVSLPAWDTVVQMFNIHSFPDPEINLITITADSNLTWMQHLRNNDLPTGETTVDSLMSLYGFTVFAYMTYYGSFAYHEVVLKSDRNNNLLPLAAIFMTIPGVLESGPALIEGDGNDISAEVYPTYIELIFSYGWMDCPAGCVWRRFWKFDAYFDCSVEYVGSYGTPLAIDSHSVQDLIYLYPNPFTDHLYIEGTHFEYSYSLFNTSGQQILRGQAANNHITSLDALPSGEYFLIIEHMAIRTPYKLVKE
jgi:hypothetical protein